jgi:hypothetical protein
MQKCAVQQDNSSRFGWRKHNLQPRKSPALLRLLSVKFREKSAPRDHLLDEARQALGTMDPEVETTGARIPVVFRRKTGGKMHVGREREVAALQLSAAAPK